MRNLWLTIPFFNLACLQYKSKALFCILLLFTVYNTYGQIINPSKIAPASPEVAALAKYVDMPVGYSSGTPQINVPLVQVKSGSLQIPISLSYNASGIRVEEGATWVGLGWNLSTGPTLNRVVRGVADDLESGYMQTFYTVKRMDTLEAGDFIMAQIENGELVAGVNLDTEPDIFSFSAMGYSGKFFYNQDSGKFILAPYQNISIAYVGSPISSFILTLPDGVKCYFGKSQDGLHSSYERLNEHMTTSLIDGISYAPETTTPQHYTAWSVMDIVSPSNRSLRYYYTSENARDFGRGGESISYVINSNVVITKNVSVYKQRVSKPVLQRIEGDFGELNFVRSPQTRLDVFGEGNSLDSIILKNNSGKKVKSFFLDHGYFTSPDSTGITGVGEFVSVARKRLYLKSVTELGDLPNPPYIFTYNSQELPNRLSASQDYWGYYNAKDNGQYLSPRVERLVDGLRQGYINENDADRRIDTNYTQARILTKVTYPTGGASEYFYEPNKASTLYYNALAGVERSDLARKSFHFPRFLDANDPNALFYIDSFKVEDIVTKVNVNAQLGNCPFGYYDASCRFHITIKGKTDPGFESHIDMTNIFYLVLPPGEYIIKATITASADPVPPFGVDLQWEERTDLNNFIVGGVRVKKIINWDGAGNMISKSLGYHFPGAPQLSSGILAGIPTHVYNPVGSGGNVLQRGIVSNSARPLTTDGQTVRYIFVTEFMDTAKLSFKTEYSFSNDWSAPMNVTGNQAVIPPNLKEWQNNQLLNKKVYETVSAGSYRLLTDEYYYYTSFESKEYTNGVLIWSTPAQARMLDSYSTSTEWYLMDSSRTLSYSYPNGQTKVSETSSRTSYSQNYLPAGNRTINSKGQVIENKTWYPSDYNDVSGFNIPSLLSKYIIQIPVKQELSVNGKIRSGNIMRYNDEGLPTEIFAYESAVTNDTVVHSRNVVVENNYVSKQLIDYLADNPIQITENSFNSSFIWDQTGNYPVAAAKNSTVSLLGYTSFEDASSGNWSGINPASIAIGAAPTGNKFLNQTAFSLAKSGLSAAAIYTVSYWSKNGVYSVGGTVSGWPKTNLTVNIGGQSWTCYEHKVTGQSTVTVNGTGSIDELRLYPEKAQMVTYAYEPLVGMTSQCDANNRITWYEYDDMGRLSLIRDQNRNVVKRFCYRYQGQSVPCEIPTDAVWEFVSSSCEQNGQSQNTGNIIIVEKDNNPASPTYNQTRNRTLENTTSCPVCNVSTCSGPDKKCINNICQTGTKVYTASVRLTSTTWKCTYHYSWSDGSVSPDYEEMRSSPCFL